MYPNIHLSRSWNEANVCDWIWGDPGVLGRIRDVGLTAGIHVETLRNPSVRQTSPPILDEGGEDAFMMLWAPPVGLSLAI